LLKMMWLRYPGRKFSCVSLMIMITYLFDVARGSGTFELDGKETFYTEKQEILFDNTQQQVNFLYEKGSEYLPGRYVMELYTDGYLMGSKSFRVK
jgi:hypothetical protein